MKNFIKNLFGKSTKPKQKTPLEILEYAVSDVGLWTWWSENFPSNIQLEFNRTMLYFDPKSIHESPSNQIAIQFKEPISVTILKKNNCSLSKDWLAEFHADKLEPFGIDYEYFSFSLEGINEIIEHADESETVFGTDLNEQELLNCNVKLGFWAGEVGIVILSNSMKIVTHAGEIPLHDIPELHNKWWSYWRQYWDVIHSEKKMPYDPICEITIPATSENLNKIGDHLEKE